MTEQNPTPELPENTPQQDHFLEDLAAATGLFNPEMIVVELEQLDELDKDQPATEQPAEPGA
ncbi:hypothetical protein [Hymenobacter pini]|uniref:hypothetical protein n=1 Tax=Hymenobacter pini TaxID=2880879 RepID=UPI001CF2D26F|nr:hypothetical protein [Hymenobacter pini]MCA8830987.1 hypothetical protein [Hymenobacter pini]